MGCVSTIVCMFLYLFVVHIIHLMMFVCMCVDYCAVARSKVRSPGECAGTGRALHRGRVRDVQRRNFVGCCTDSCCPDTVSRDRCWHVRLVLPPRTRPVGTNPGKK